MRVKEEDEHPTTVRVSVVVGTRAAQIGSIFQLSLSHSAACNLFPGRRNAYLCRAVFSLLWSWHKRAFSRRLRARQLWSTSPLRCQKLQIFIPAGCIITSWNKSDWTWQYFGHANVIFSHSVWRQMHIFTVTFWCPINTDVIQNTV